MEVLLAFTILIFALCLLLHIATRFIKELKSGKSTRLTNGFKANLSIIPIDKQKSEASAGNTNFTNDHK